VGEGSLAPSFAALVFCRSLVFVFVLV